MADLIPKSWCFGAISIRPIFSNGVGNCKSIAEFPPPAGAWQDAQFACRYDWTRRSSDSFASYGLANLGKCCGDAGSRDVSLGIGLWLSLDAFIASGSSIELFCKAFVSDESVVAGGGLKAFGFKRKRPSCSNTANWFAEKVP